MCFKTSSSISTAHKEKFRITGVFALIDFCLLLYNLVCLSSKGDFLYLLFFPFKKKVLNEIGREFKWNKEKSPKLETPLKNLKLNNYHSLTERQLRLVWRQG